MLAIEISKYVVVELFATIRQRILSWDDVKKSRKTVSAFLTEVSLASIMTFIGNSSSVREKCNRLFV